MLDEPISLVRSRMWQLPAEGLGYSPLVWCQSPLRNWEKLEQLLFSRVFALLFPHLRPCRLLIGGGGESGNSPIASHRSCRDEGHLE